MDLGKEMQQEVQQKWEKHSQTINLRSLQNALGKVNHKMQLKPIKLEICSNVRAGFPFSAPKVEHRGTKGAKQHVILFKAATCY